MARIADSDLPEHLFYDVENQIWYEPLQDVVRCGFTSISMTLAGTVLVFTPKRIGREFEKGRSFAVIECGKCAFSARAAFHGTVISHNELLIEKPELLNEDAFGKGWMILARPAGEDWRQSLITGWAIEAAFHEWLAAEKYKDRVD